MIIEKNMVGVDFAYLNKPATEIAETMRDLDYKFVVRYISPNTKKNLTPAERDIYHAAGIQILLVWEVDATRPTKGAAYGQADGTMARIQAYKLGYPSDVCVLCAFDTDVFWGNISMCEAYGRAFQKAVSPYPFGVYGDADILIRLQDICKLGWLPNASAWSSSARKYALELNLIHVFQNRQITQYGQTWDTNTVVRPFNAWGPAVQAVPPIVVPGPPVQTLPPISAALIGATMSAAVTWVAIEGQPERYLSNGFVLKKYPNMAVANAAQLIAHTENSASTPVWVSQEYIDSFAKV